jgi:hypothetical protein
MRRRILVGCLVPVLLVVTVAAAACSRSPGGAVVATAGGGATPSATPSLSFLAQGIRYAQCMRQHGIPMPDPSVDANGGVHIAGVDKQSLDGDVFNNGLRACEPYKPVAPPDLLTDKLATQREYSRCMRAHGVENFPDPDPDGRFPLPAEQTDPDYDQAKVACDAAAQSARASAGATP